MIEVWRRWSFCRSAFVFVVAGVVAFALLEMAPAFAQPGGFPQVPPSPGGGLRRAVSSPGAPPKSNAPSSAATAKATSEPEGDNVSTVQLALPSATASDALSDGLKFNSAPLDIVLEDYGENTGRTLLRGPGIPTPTFTLRSQGDLTVAERLKAIETMLSMHGIGLVPIDENFIKVVPIKAIRREPMDILEAQQGMLPETTGELVSQMIVLKHIDVVEATKTIEPLKHDYGQITPFERTNSILVTDTAPNINRMLQIIRYVDQPIEAREEPNIIQIHYAKASDIKSKLEEIIADSQKEQRASTVPQAKKTGAPAPTKSSAPPGVIRPRAAVPVAAPAALDDLVALAERGVIRGKVKIVSDERTNLLIIITRPENMKFFDKIIRVLDVETTPDVVVEVLRLEFAQAKDVASMLNDLIGATKNETEGAPVAGAGDADAAKGEENSRSKALGEYVKDLSQPKVNDQAQSKLGQLSTDNIKILSDERTNALILMASKGDLLVLKRIINDMDMMLSQVLIEVVILEIGLSDTAETGVDWVQKSLVAYDEEADGGRTPIFSFAGGGGGGSTTPTDATSLGSPVTGAGLTYYFTHFGLNTDMVLKMVASDSNSRVLSSPVIVTHDNTEAKIDSSEQRYFYKGQKYVGYNSTGGGAYEADVESRDVGIQLTVTPHINTNKLVLMEIAQKVEQLGEEQLIEGQKWPTVLKREMSASIAVRNRETIVLGGLVQTRKVEGNSGIPFLRKIPLFGMLFRSKSKDSTRGEVVVFITPYVLDTPEEIAAESRRRKETLDTEGMWQHGWSDSSLADREEKKKSVGRRRRSAKSSKTDQDIDEYVGGEEERWAEDQEATE